LSKKLMGVRSLELLIKYGILERHIQDGVSKLGQAKSIKETINLIKTNKAYLLDIAEHYRRLYHYLPDNSKVDKEGLALCAATVGEHLTRIGFSPSELDGDDYALMCLGFYFFMYRRAIT